jgi:uncharacterized repeat protein (TIGR01451 family)
VTVHTGTSAYPTIAANGTARNVTPYTVTVAREAICGNQLSFQQAVTYNGGQTVVNTMPLPVGKPISAPVQTRMATGVPAAIPDYYGPGLIVNLPISGVTGTVADLNVRVSLSHSWDDDLVLLLISPAGTVVTLSNRHGSDNDNYVNTVFDDEAATAISAGYPAAWPPFTGSFKPDSPLSAVRGETINGTWKLKVVDVSQDDTGTVTAFGLDVVPSTYQCASVGSGPDLTLSMSHAGTFSVGQTGTYALTVRNANTAASTTGPITVADTLPTGLSYVSGGGNGWTCGAIGQIVTCTNAGPIQPGGSSGFTLSVAVADTAIPAVVNTATVSTPGESNASNNAAADPTSVGCATRPPVGLAVTRGASGELNVTVTAGVPPIKSVEFQLSSGATSHNARIDVPADPSIASIASAGILNQTQDFTLHVGVARVRFVVNRIQSGGFTVPLAVTDGCGSFQTFVGYGS